MLFNLLRVAYERHGSVNSKCSLRNRRRFCWGEKEKYRDYARVRGEKKRGGACQADLILSIQLSPSRVPLARSIREINKNKQTKKKPAPATKVCPAFFPKAANGPRWDLISYPDLTLFYTPFPLDVGDLGMRLGGTSRFIQKPLHPS